MKNVRRDVFVLARDEAARALIEHDQAGRVRRADMAVGVVHAGAAVQVKVIVVNEDGAVGRVVRPDARARGEVKPPNHLWIERVGCLVCFGFRVSVCGFPRQGPWIEAQHFAAIADQKDTVPFDGYWRGNAAVGPVVVNVLGAFGDGELPEEAPGLFLETHQNAAVALVGGVARMPVVGADIHAATRDHRCGVGFRAEFRDPFDIAPGIGVKGVGQSPLLRDQVTGPGLAPLRLVGGAGRDAQGPQGQAAQQQRAQEAGVHRLRRKSGGNADARQIAQPYQGRVRFASGLVTTAMTRRASFVSSSICQSNMPTRMKSAPLLKA